MSMLEHHRFAAWFKATDDPSVVIARQRYHLSHATYHQISHKLPDTLLKMLWRHYRRQSGAHA